MKSIITEDHKTRPNNFCTSPAMDRYAKKISEEAGRNANNQASISHGYQVLVLRAMMANGIDTKKIYNKIKH